jgi:predicted acyltransferase
MNMLSGNNMFGNLDPIKPFFGVLIEGNVPFMVLTGLIGGLIIKKFQSEKYLSVILTFTGLGIFCLAAGFILRNWFIISKIQATPSWGMICSGISFLLFALIFWIIDVKKRSGWALFLKPAGENSLTTYLVPEILYYIILMSGVPVLIYKQSQNPLIAVFGSLIWAFFIIGLAKILSGFNIRLRI